MSATGLHSTRNSTDTQQTPEDVLTLLMIDKNANANEGDAANGAPATPLGEADDGEDHPAVYSSSDESSAAPSAAKPKKAKKGALTNGVHKSKAKKAIAGVIVQFDLMPEMGAYADCGTFRCVSVLCSVAHANGSDVNPRHS